MKTIFLKKMDLKNFKGIKDLSIDFSKVTNIYGENATGKTSIFDAFTWLLFDKDSQDRSKFNIQPLDESNNVVHMIETEVTGLLEIDNIPIILKKVLKEKWVKKRGEVEAELKGTETSYYVNEVPFKQGEYQKKIADITGDEDIFKLLSNPLYFGMALKWQDRRKIIFDINGDADMSDVINYNSKLADLSKYLKPDEDIETFKKRVKAQITKLRKDKESIPARVDELSRAIRNDIDFDMQEKSKNDVISNIKLLDEQILDSSKVGQEVLNKKNQFYDLKSKLRDMEYSLKLKAQEPLSQLQNKLRKIERNIYDVQSKADITLDKINLIENSIQSGESLLLSLRNQWNEENQKTLQFDEDEFICPTCHRTFDDADVETKKREMTENFNQTKAEKKKKISETGKVKSSELEQFKQEVEQLKQQHKEYESELTGLVAQKAEINKQIAEFQPTTDFADNTEYQELKRQIESLEVEINIPAAVNNQVQELRHKKSNLEIELDGINNLLSYKGQNKSLEKRKAELMEGEKRLSQQIAELEKQEYLTEEFTKTKVELLENSINNKFRYVKFKLFNTLVNGAIEECCEPLIDGVPFSNANTASQYNAGIDIINALSEFYGIQAPIFLDNRESVNRLIFTDSQVINLIVSNDKELRIEGSEI